MLLLCAKKRLSDYLLVLNVGISLFEKACEDQQVAGFVLPIV